MNLLAAAVYNRLAFVKKIRREIGKHPRRDKIIHVGCGTGNYIADLASIAGEVVGVDPDEKKLEIARRLYPHLKFYHMDGTRTVFADGQFDTAFLIMFLHEVCSEEIIRECCRIAGEVVVFDYSRVLYGIRGRLIRLIEKDKYEKYAAVNLAVKFAEIGFSLREGRSIHPNFYMYSFVRGRAARGEKKAGTVIQFVKAQGGGRAGGGSQQESRGQ